MKYYIIFLVSLFFIAPVFSQNSKGKTILNKKMFRAPIFPGCNLYRKKLHKSCFSQKLNEHIRIHFRYPKVALDSGFQGRVFIKFDINKNGVIKNITARGPYPFFEEEAIRIISKLPKMVPAKDKEGNAMTIPFSIPITFRLE